MNTGIKHIQYIKCKYIQRIHSMGILLKKQNILRVKFRFLYQTLLRCTLHCLYIGSSFLNESQINFKSVNFFLQLFLFLCALRPPICECTSVDKIPFGIQHILQYSICYLGTLTIRFGTWGIEMCSSNNETFPVHLYYHRLSSRRQFLNSEAT